MTAPTLGWANPSASPGRAPDRAAATGPMAIGSNPLRSTRKSAQIDVISYA
jgi:hypothetical protein